MKATGIVRRIDDLGRVVIPKEIRRTIDVYKRQGYQLAVEALGLNPMLNLGMRLGEGTGCPLAMLLVENALVIMNEMSTFEEANLETDYRKNLKA